MEEDCENNKDEDEGGLYEDNDEDQGAARMII
jgi:hypothetical protein